MLGIWSSLFPGPSSDIVSNAEHWLSKFKMGKTLALRENECGIGSNDCFSIDIDKTKKGHFKLHRLFWFRHRSEHPTTCCLSQTATPSSTFWPTDWWRLVCYPRSVTMWDPISRLGHLAWFRQCEWHWNWMMMQWIGHCRMQTCQYRFAHKWSDKHANDSVSNPFWKLPKERVATVLWHRRYQGVTLIDWINDFKSVKARGVCQWEQEFHFGVHRCYSLGFMVSVATRGPYLLLFNGS